MARTAGNAGPARRRRSRAGWLALLLPALLLGAGDASAQTEKAAQAQKTTPSQKGSPALSCQEGSGLALLGFDTAAGKLLFELASADAGPRFLVELDLGQRAARWQRMAPEKPLFAGSVGPGPVFALRSCGDGCAAAHQWRQGRFTALGGPLTLAESTNLYSTYDRSGHPWVVMHRPGPPPWLDASAYRLERGQWQPRGRLSVVGALAGGVMPAPWDEQGVISGTGLFSAGAAASTWLEGFPKLPPGKEGEVAALGNGGAVYFAADGAVYSSPDRGRSWQGSRFRPWGSEPTEIWTYGSDYSLDLPLGTLGEPLPLAWFDHRGGRSGRLFLTALSPVGDWRVTGELASEVAVEGTEPVEWIHLLHRDGGTWVLVSDCFDRQGVPTVAVRTSTLAGVEALQLLPITPLP